LIIAGCTDLRLIPVLDVMRGVVVHAVRGQRSEYKPLASSVLCDAPSNPFRMLQCLKDAGFSEVYIADLDSIEGRGGNADVIRYARSLGFRVYADVGRRGLELTEEPGLEFVIGTEYLVYPSELVLHRSRTASLDMVGLSVKFANGTVPLAEALSRIADLGISYRRLFIIFLDRVGSMEGPNIEAVKTVREIYRGELIVGGGVRGPEDLEALERLGVDGVIVATALHRGLIKPPRGSTHHG